LILFFLQERWKPFKDEIDYQHFGDIFVGRTADPKHRSYRKGKTLFTKAHQDYLKLGAIWKDYKACTLQEEAFRLLIAVRKIAIKAFL